MVLENEVSHLAEDDGEQLARLLKDVAEEDPEGLLGTGYDVVSLDALIAGLQAEEFDVSSVPVREFDENIDTSGIKTATCPECGMSSHCDGGWPPFPKPQEKPQTVAIALPWTAENWYMVTASNERHALRGKRPVHSCAARSAPTITKTRSRFNVVQLPQQCAPKAYLRNGAAYVLRRWSESDIKVIGTFPTDFRFTNEAKAWEHIGNSVPPKFAQAIATCIRERILADRDFTYISLFAGCGGSSLGYKWAGGHGLAAVEFNANAAETYRLNFPETLMIERDIATVTARELMELTDLRVGELDVLDGSPPCQGFSTAGKRQLDDPRNTLFREYVRLVEGLQPKVFVMENVSGMVKGKMKLVFRTIMETLKATGYTVRCQLLNAMYYGVPQSRERLIWIGVRPDIGPIAEAASDTP
jgi:site-specific DNA-cytosine methylase